MKKMYCLVVTDDYSRFTWILFLATKDETSGILKSFITGIENLVDHKVKVIKCDNETEFKNREMNQFCEMKGILRQFSVARTSQQNKVAERRNRTLIEADRTMLADSKLPTTFWTETVNTACYVQNRVLVVKPHNKTPYELFHGRTPTLSFMRPFRCFVTILNTIDHLDKFDGKADEGFFVGYSLKSKAFRVFNSITKIVEENLYNKFSESTSNVVGSGPDWLFSIDALTRTINYEPIVAGIQSNSFAGTKASDNAGQARKENLLKITYCYHYGLLIHYFLKIQRVLMMMDPNLRVMIEISVDELKIMMQSYCEMMSKRREQTAQKEQELLEQEQVVEEKQELLAEEQAANPFEPSPTSFDAITPEFSITDSLSMGDEHLSTIPKTKSDEVIKSSVKNLVPILSESEVTFDNESECDVPVNDESSPIFTTFSNPLFDCNDDFTSSDDKSLSNEDVSMEIFKIYLNPLFDDEEIISTKIDLHYFKAESNLLESLLNQDTLIDSSPKFAYLLEEFSGELAHIDPIPPGIEEADFHLEEEIRLFENLSYDNSSPRPPKELNAEITDTILESLSPSSIPVEDSDSHMEEIDLFLATDDLMPPGIENDDYDSERDIHFLEELLSNDPFPILKNVFDFKINDEKMVDEDPRKENKFNAVGENISIELQFDPNTHALENISTLDFLSDDEDDGAVADMNNLDTTIQIEKEVYVYQPLGFEDSDFPVRVYKVEQALYGLHQAPIAWFTEVKTTSPPMETQKPLLKDEYGKEVDVHMYRLMIGLLIYLTSSRPDIMFVVCAYARYQVNPKFYSTAMAKTINEEVQLHAQVDGKEIVITKSSVRRDLQIADEEASLGERPGEAFYCSGFIESLKKGVKIPDQNAFSSTMASAIICLATIQKFNFSKLIFDSMIRNLDNVSGKFLMYPRVTPLFPTMVVQNQSQLGEGSVIPTNPQHTPTILQPSSSQPQKTQNPRRPIRKDTQVPQPSVPTDNVADEAVHKELGDSLVRATITASSLEAKCQETMKDTIAQTRVLDLEKTKTTQCNEIDSLKRRVKKLEKRNRDEENLGKDASKQGRRIDAINADEDITLVNDADKEMFDVDDLGGEEVFVARKNDNVVEEVVNDAQVSTVATTVTITTKEITLSQALEALKTSKPKVKGIVFQEPDKSKTTTTTSLQQSQDKGKGIMIEEPVKPKKKDQIRLDEEAAIKLPAEFDEEEILAREKAEKKERSNIALIEE
uniref:Putative ribonuclease H-like domain-containing protein n=1 Tax=Tanacetum cinerariifolium TaxID=118510 RepID=A0A6L2MYP0_TANCI|nr:putative ribonuclease H-like domain-containing protein [Tanacetum cinerariifolium]